MLIVSVDESWLKRQSAESRQPHQGCSILSDSEIGMIKADLANCHGRISEPSARLRDSGFRDKRLKSASVSCHQILFPILGPNHFEM
jgi:hypothetical protein